MQMIQQKIEEATTAADDLQSKLDTMRSAANAAALLTATIKANKTKSQHDAACESISFDMALVRMFADGVHQRAQEISDIACEIITWIDGDTR